MNECVLNEHCSRKSPLNNFSFNGFWGFYSDILFFRFIFIVSSIETASLKLDAAARTNHSLRLFLSAFGTLHRLRSGKRLNLLKFVLARNTLVTVNRHILFSKILIKKTTKLKTVP